MAISFVAPGREARVRWMKCVVLVVSFAAILLGTGGSARADHILAHTISAKSCFPHYVGALGICAEIDMALHYHPVADSGHYTVRTTARGSTAVGPGTLEARRTFQVLQPPALYESTLTCRWGAFGGACDLDFPEIGSAVFPVGLCQPIHVDLSATARLIDDPVLRLLPVNARAIQDILMCWDGTVTVT